MTLSSSRFRASVALALGLIGALLILFAWNLPPFRTAVETTENAYVRGQVTAISPQVAGYVTTVAVRDFQEVKAGDILVQIDPRRYEQQLAQARATLEMKRAALAQSEQAERAGQADIRSAEAQVESARAAVKVAELTAGRVEALLPKGVATQSSADEAHSTLAQARAALHQAEAAVDAAREELQTVVVNRQSLRADIDNAEAAVSLAEIDLGNTRVTAPRDGRLGEVGVQLGQYVTAGSQLAYLVPDRKWVMANFKETQLHGMRIGQPVTFTVDAFGGARMTGRIAAFSPATGSEFSVLKSDNATGNFTKITRRLPVRIAIDPGQERTADLAPGMSVVVRVDTAAPALPPEAAPGTPAD